MILLIATTDLIVFTKDHRVTIKVGCQLLKDSFDKDRIQLLLSFLRREIKVSFLTHAVECSKNNFLRLNS